MSKRLYRRYISNFDVNLMDCKFLGKGHNGAVYLLPDGKVIKICYEEKSCRREYNILKRIKNNKYFPRTYGMCGNYMIRDCVEGVCLTKHIKANGLSRELSIKILKLFDEFKKLNFSKEDIRCKDIMVKPDGEIMVIDPKKFYTKKRDFPRHLAKGLYNLDVLNEFMKVVKEERPKLYKRWNPKIQEYIMQRYNSSEAEDAF